MFGYLVLLFTVVPAVELMLLIKVGTYIGAMNTMTIIILTGVLGAYLARLQGFFVFRKIQDNLNNGIMPNEELIDGVLIFVGGLVLLTPGFITDAMGFLLLIPLTRNLIKSALRAKFDQMVREGHVHSFDTSGPPHSNRIFDNNDDIEDADFHS